MSDGTPQGFIRKTADGRYRVDWRAVAPESFFTTERLVAEVVRRSHLANGNMLDIGCGTKPYREVFADRVSLEHVCGRGCAYSETARVPKPWGYAYDGRKPSGSETSFA